MNPKLTLLIFPALLACPDGKTVSVIQNIAPEATITVPIAGSTLPDGTNLFVGKVSDQDDQFANLSVSWYINDSLDAVEGCAGTVPTVSEVSCEIPLTENDTQVRLEVTDLDGEVGIASVVFTVTETEAPTASITEPTDASTHYANQIINFVGVVGDAETPPEDLSVTWSSTEGGDLTLATTITTDGTASASGTLQPGQQTITMTVEDADGKSASDSVTINVLEANTPPSCSWTEPVDGSIGLLGESVIFKGTATDAETSSNNLLVEINSSVDGVIGNPTLDSAGNFAFPYSDLTADIHTLSLTVTDDGGEVCVSNLIYSVNSPPTIVLSNPTDGSTYEEGESVNFSALITDAEETASQLSTSWESDLDGVFSTATPDSTGNINFNISDFSAGTHNIAITATDSNGLFSTENLHITINGAPTQPTVGIIPDPANTNDQLTASASGSIDPNGNTVTYTYLWSHDNFVTSSPGQLLAASATNKGDTWVVRATPNDGSLDGPYGEASITIGNTAPEVSNISLSPSIVYTNDTLTATVTASDDDGDGLTYTYDWYVAGGLAYSNTSSAITDTLDGSVFFDRSQDVYVIVTVNDGSSTDSMTSSSILVSNTVPEASNVSIVPTEPMAQTDDLVCSATGFDADGDTITFTYEWQENGLTTTYTGDTLPAVETENGDIWTCILTPNDGTDNGSSVQVSVTINSNLEGAEGSELCASAGVVTNSSYSIDFCLSSSSLTVDPSNSSWTLQGSSNIIFTPSNQ